MGRNAREPRLSRSTPLFALLGALLLVGGWYLIGGAGRRGTGLAPTPVSHDESDGAATIEAAPGAKRSDVAPAHEPAAGPLDAEPAEPERYLFQGTLIAIDSAGREYPHEDGLLVLDPGGAPFEVPIARGKFRVWRTESLACWSVGAELGGRAVVLRNPGPAYAGSSLHLVADLPESARLRVVSAATGAPLDGVDVAGDYPRVRLVAHPGANWRRYAVAEGAASPVALGAPTQDRDIEGEPFRSYAVRAPGHAWGNAVVNLRDGGDREVRLVPGGHVEVALEGFESDSGVLVTFLIANEGEVTAPKQESGPSASAGVGASAAGEPGALERPRGWRSALAREPDERGVARIESIPVGTWIVRASRAADEERAGGRTLLATGHVQVVADETAHLRLALEEPAPSAPSDRAPLNGLLIVGGDWGDARIGMTVKPIAADGATKAPTLRIEPGELVPVAGRDGEFAWDAGLVPLGSVQVSVSMVGVVREFEVGPGGLQGVRIECPAPALVALTLVDPRSGEAVVAQRVDFSRVVRGAGGTSLHGVISAFADPERVYRFRAVPGTYRFGIWKVGFEERGYEIEVVPGVNDLRVELARSCGISLELSDGRRAVPVEFGLVERIELDGEEVPGLGKLMIGGQDALRILLAEPGHYRLHLGPIAGYRDVPPVDAVVTAGEFTDVMVELEPVD